MPIKLPKVTLTFNHSLILVWVKNFGKVDTFNGADVLALRCEDLPFVVFFSKKEFSQAVASIPGKYTNQKRTINGCPKKATLIPFHSIPAHSVEEILQGNFVYNVLITCLCDKSISLKQG